MSALTYVLYTMVLSMWDKLEVACSVGGPLKKIAKQKFGPKMFVQQRDVNNTLQDLRKACKSGWAGSNVA